jgi:ABC transporter
VPERAYRAAPASIGSTTEARPPSLAGAFEYEERRLDVFGPNPVAGQTRNFNVAHAWSPLTNPICALVRDHPQPQAAQDLRRGWALKGISLTVRAGEVIGIAGLVGSGRSELLRAIFGAERIDGGEMRLLGKPYAPRSPVDASAAGIGLIPEDRKPAGFVPAFSISRNLSLPSLRTVSNLGL